MSLATRWSSLSKLGVADALSNISVFSLPISIPSTKLLGPGMNGEKHQTNIELPDNDLKYPRRRPRLQIPGIDNILAASIGFTWGNFLAVPTAQGVQGPKKHKILILDGVGDDWAESCAKSYPNVIFYCVGPLPLPYQTANLRQPPHPLIKYDSFNMLLVRFSTGEIARFSGIYPIVSHNKDYIRRSMLTDTVDIWSTVRRKIKKRKIVFGLSTGTFVDLLLPEKDNVYGEGIKCYLGFPVTQDLTTDTVPYPLTPVGLFEGRNELRSSKYKQYRDVLDLVTESSFAETSHSMAGIARWWYFCRHPYNPSYFKGASRDWRKKLLSECQQEGTRKDMVFHWVKVPSTELVQVSATSNP